jgi:protocatechuate 3,4-dioxygenase beta subunit
MENRRKFLRNVTLTSLGVGVIPAIAKGSQNNSLLSVPPPPPCNPTTSDYYGEGPFYTPDAPFIGDDNLLADGTELGQRLIISGVVRNLDCTEVIPDAVIDLWHADGNGDYDNTGYYLRGKTTSNASGFYLFETIKPGKYLNGDTYRPSHIHVKVTAPGYPTLTTQIYFTGDTSIPTDAAASITSGTYDATHRTIDLETVDGKLEGVWDIVVDGEGVNVVGMESLHLENGMIYEANPNPFLDELEIKYGVFKNANVSIEVTDIQGRTVAKLKEENHEANKYVAVWQPEAGLPTGHYFIVIRVNDLQVHHLRVYRQGGYK